MNKLFRDSTGKVCAAKTAFMSTLFIFLGKIALSGITIFGVTFEQVTPELMMAMTTFITPLGITYFGRSWTKATAGEVKQ